MPRLYNNDETSLLPRSSGEQLQCRDSNLRTLMFRNIAAFLLLASFCLAQAQPEPAAPTKEPAKKEETKPAPEEKPFSRNLGDDIPF